MAEMRIFPDSQKSVAVYQTFLSLTMLLSKAKNRPENLRLLTCLLLAGETDKSKQVMR